MLNLSAPSGGVYDCINQKAPISHSPTLANRKAKERERLFLDSGFG